MPASSIEHRSARAWHKIIIHADALMTEAVSAYLADLTGTGLEISSLEKDGTNTGHTFPAEIITAYIPIGPKESDKKAAADKIEALRKFLAKLTRIFTGCSTPRLKTETIMEEDWGKKWKSFFTTFQITPTLTIKPSWEDAEEQHREKGANKVVIEMDPGLAFGTGHHASTQLALLLLEALYRDNAMKLDKVLDVGTGSGILAMACGLFGAREILAIDNDPDAVETAKQNILRNRLEGRVTVSGQDAASLEAGFDMVVANITHDILEELAPTLADLIHPNGFLVLSGILKGDQENSVRDIYTGQAFHSVRVLTKDEWAALLFQKNN